MENQKNVEVNVDEINYIKRTLANYYYLINEENKERREAMSLNMQIEDEMRISGISYDDLSGNGCSASFPKESYLHQLVLECDGYDRRADQFHKKHVTLNNHNRITKRIEKLSDGQQMLIYAVFRKQMSYTDVAKELYKDKDGNVPSKQFVAERVNDAIVAFLER